MCRKCSGILNALLYCSSSLAFFLAATPIGGRAPDATQGRQQAKAMDVISFEPSRIFY